MFLHLLPQTFVGEVHEEGARFIIVDEHRNTILGLAMFFGFLAFITLEKAMRIMGAGHDHDHEHGHSHSHDNKTGLDHDSITITRKTHVEYQERDEEPEDDDEDVVEVKKASGVEETNNSSLKKRKVHAEISDSYTIEEKEGGSESSEPKASVKLSAYLNLVADFTHNITDGLAISASFYISKNVGATTCLAVFFHEIPHEVGDFALLIQGGFTKNQAMYAQFVTAIGAYLGTFIGIAINYFATSSGRGNGLDSVIEAGKATGIFGTNVQISDLTLPFTAGGFLYIGTVGVIPEIIEADEELSRVEQVKKSLVNLLAMLIGIGLMFAISWSE